jgi:CHAD domain-containing protein
MYSNKGKYLIKSFKQSQKILLRQLPGISSKLKRKNLHKARIAIKKINTVYRLLDFIDPDTFNRKKHYKTVGKIFRSLGKLRELQLNDNYIKSQHLPFASQKLYSIHTATEKLKAERKAQKAITKFDKISFHKSTKLVNKLAHNLDNDTVLIKTKQFIPQETNEIKILFKDYRNQDKVHKIRKILKSIHYTIDFLNNIDPSLKSSTILQRLKEAETLIGKWHDNVALLQFIHKLPEKSPGVKPKIIEPFNKISTTLSEENITILNQLEPKLENIIKKLDSLTISPRHQS